MRQLIDFLETMRVGGRGTKTSDLKKRSEEKGEREADTRPAALSNNFKISKTQIISIPK